MKEKTRIKLVDIDGNFSSTNGCWGFIVVKSHTLINFYNSTYCSRIRYPILFYCLSYRLYSISPPMLPEFLPTTKDCGGCVCVSLKRLPKMACRSLAATCGRIRFTESASQTRGTTQRLWWRGPSALSSGGGLIMKTAFCFADIHLSLTEIICCKETLATAQVKQLSFHTVSLYRRWDPRTAF